MVDSIVTRTLNVDFIYFDIIFLSVWIYFLIKKRYWVPLLWGIFGWVIYLGVDYYLWYIVMESRQYSGNLPPWLFFLWFCFSPGFVQFSYVFVMFEKRNKNELIFWTILFYGGWLFVGLCSQWISINDDIILVSRNMNAGNQRFIFSILTVLNLLLAYILIKMNVIRIEDGI